MPNIDWTVHFADILRIVGWIFAGLVGLWVAVRVVLNRLDVIETNQKNLSHEIVAAAGRQSQLETKFGALETQVATLNGSVQALMAIFSAVFGKITFFKQAEKP